MNRGTHVSEQTLTEDVLNWSAEYEPHPAGIYKAKLDSVEVVTSAEEYGAKPRLRLTFATEATTKTGEPMIVSVFSAPSLDPRAKIRPFLVALGEDLTECAKKFATHELKISSFIGRAVVVVVEQQPRQDGQGIRSKIVSFQPMPAKRPKPKFDVDDDE
jgi:hypothetical protein